MSAPDGGPAFPAERKHTACLPTEGCRNGPGMTLRAWLTGQALVGILSRGSHDLSISEKAQYSEDAVDVADATLALLAKEKP